MKIYKVTDISFSDLTIEATRTDLSIVDIPENEVFTIDEFREFWIRLINRDGSGMGTVVDSSERIKTRKHTI